tara:strand:- start:872 stop:1102 length:231 start_codon:yes stop_codon:yes gene_type:complete
VLIGVFKSIYITIFYNIMSFFSFIKQYLLVIDNTIVFKNKTLLSPLNINQSRKERIMLSKSRRSSEFESNPNKGIV